MKILLISNSFGVNLQIYANDIAKLNGLDLDIYTLFIGGCPLRSHDANIKENKKDYELFINGVRTGRFISINEALLMDNWDYVSLQQASHVSGIVDSYYPYFNNVYTYVRSKCPKAKIMWHQTWAYSGKNPYKYNEVKQWLPAFNFKNDIEMKKGIDKCLKKILEDYKIDLVIRSGDVVFEGMKEFDDLYDSEGFHLNELGCYMIGNNLVKTILNHPLKKVFVPSDIDEKMCKKAVDFVNNLR